MEKNNKREDETKDYSKAFKPEKTLINYMSPGNLNRLPDESFSKETLIFIDVKMFGFNILSMPKTSRFLDDGFLSKISKFFGKGKHLKVHRKDFAELLARKEKLKLTKIFVYTSPPFQSPKPTPDETKRKEGYDKFVKSLINEGITVKEGRCQRLKIEGKYVYSQKGVDSLLIIDLMKAKKDHKDINKVILVASDSDFVPIINYLQTEEKIKVILYTYFEKGRNSRFSTSNELIKTVYKYVNLTKNDFEELK